jgi:hypothetical protein
MQENWYKATLFISQVAVFEDNTCHAALTPLTAIL